MKSAIRWKSRALLVVPIPQNRIMQKGIWRGLPPWHRLQWSSQGLRCLCGGGPSSVGTGGFEIFSVFLF
jgi:hypothetical protein